MRKIVTKLTNGPVVLALVLELGDADYFTQFGLT